MQGKLNSGRTRKSALIGSTAILMGMAVAGTASAQQAAAPAAPAGPQTTAEVVVTGSRIARRDFTSNSPIVTVNAQTFQNTANVAIETTLNQLPQFVPDQNLTGVQSEDVQPTATHTVGISTASLRGLGANRTLILADGDRLQPVNGSLVVDLNSIPSAIIDHVEVVTGGASAVYGADAVAGVVNFILKKNYQGMDVDAQYGFTQAGDGQQFKISTIIGGNFADDKGNVTFALEHYTRAPSYEENRSFYTKGWSDPSTGTNEFFNTGSYFFGPSTPPSEAAMIHVFGAGAAAGGPFGGFNILGFNNNGTMNAGTFGSPGAFGTPLNYTGTVNGSSVAYENYVSPTNTVIQGIKTNQVSDYYITSPLNRWSMYGDAHYDITPDLTAYMRGTFSSTHTSTNLFSTPFITGWTADIPFNYVTDSPVTATGAANPSYIGPGQAGAQHPVPADLGYLLQNPAFGGPAYTFWEPWLIPSTNGGWLPPRSTIDDNNVWQMTAGLKGNLPLGDWTWNAYGAHGQASDYTLGQGDVSLQRLTAILDSPDYGAGQTFVGNQGNSVGNPNSGFGIQPVTCTSGFYGALFLNQRPSQDCINAIVANIQSRVLEEQNVVEFDAQGTLFKAPAGDVKLSLGADYRDEHVIYTPDILQSTASFIDQVAGVYPASYENAMTQAREGYGELLIPVVKDLPFVKEFNLDIGARYSTYTATNELTSQNITPPGGWTYKIEGDWKITDWARLRGGYNLAVRSPNVGELFLTREQVYAAASTIYGDPCSLASNAPFGAGGAAPDPVTGATYQVVNKGGLAGAQQALAICKALMGPTGAAYYYGGSHTAQPAPGATPFIFTQLEGNTNLKAEKAHTWTAGVVLSSPVRGNPWLDQLRGSIDWYDIRVNDVIEFVSPDLVREACLSQTGNAAADAADALCADQYTRNPGTGGENYTTINYANQATIRTSGIDFNVNYGWRFEDVGMNAIPGRVNINWLATYLLYYDTQAYPGGPWFQWAGSLGPSLSSVDPGAAYRYKSNLTLTYAEGPVSVSLNWEYLPHVHSENYPLYEVQPGGLASCGQPTTVGGTDCTLDTHAYHLFNLSATYTIKQNYVLRAGINNLFNTAPPITGATSGTGTVGNAGYTLPSSGQGTTMEGIYDAIGRQFYVGINAKF